MKTKRTFENFKKAVANESKHYPSLRRYKGNFNERFLRAAFDEKQTAIQCCNSITERT